VWGWMPRQAPLGHATLPAVYHLLIAELPGGSVVCRERSERVEWNVVNEWGRERSERVEWNVVNE
jgi:hypothetical protein